MEMTKAQTNELAQSLAAEYSSSDIELPRVHVMQGISQKVMDGEAKFGEFRSSFDNKLLGSIEKPMEFIPLSMYKVWHAHNGSELVEIEPWTPANDKRPREHNGLVYSLVRNFYVLVPGEPLPFIIGFKKTSSRAGMALATQIMINQKMGKAPWAKIIKLTGSKEKNDKGTFIKLGIIASRDIKKSEEHEALEWLNIIKTKTVPTENIHQEF